MRPANKMNETQATKKPSKEAVKKLFVDAAAAEKEVDKAREVVTQAIAKRSALVKSIFDATGKNGPFQFQGNVLQIRARKQKNEEMITEANPEGFTGEETWFFVTMGDKELDVIG